MKQFTLAIAAALTASVVYAQSASAPITAGSTDNSVIIRIVDSTTGLPETGVTDATSGLDLEYYRIGAAPVDITETDLSAHTDAHADGGLLHIGNGYYRLDLPDAAVAAGVNSVLIEGTATDMVVVGTVIPLTSAAEIDDAIFETTIDAYTNGTTFSVAAAAADDDAINGWSIVVFDQSTGNQVAAGVISDYTASGANIVLDEDPGIFTFATGDTVKIYRPQTVGGSVTVEGTVSATFSSPPAVNVTQFAGTAIAESTAGNIADNFSIFYDNGDATSTQTQDDVGAGSGLTLAGIADAVLDEALSGHVTAGTVGKTLADTLADTGELQVDWANGGRLDLILDTAAGSGGETAAAIADALLDEAMSGHTTAGTLGAAITAIQNQSDVATALRAIHLDHLFAVEYDPASKPGVGTALLNETIWNNSGVSVWNVNVTHMNESEMRGTGTTGDDWTGNP